jgi:hypothetical protein
MIAAVAFGLAFPFAAVAQQKAPLSADVQKDLTNSKAHYDNEKDPVGRAKALGKLGRAEIRAAHEMANAGDFDGALQYLKNYDDQAHEGHDALLKTGVNAENHSSGFRQLQISLRESIRAVREIADQVPYTQRQPFDAQHQDLEDLNQRLILELFPRQPGHKPQKENR